MIEITYVNAVYNNRRYGKPWIARVDYWPIGKSPVCEFGYLARDGRTLTVAAEPGDILYRGQRDHRGSHCEWVFGRATAEGTFEPITKREARAAFRKASVA